jgi:F-type H+-transporting ATPase subunit delta
MAIAVANRYARALADVVAATSGDYRQVRQQVEEFAAVLRESRELQAVFESPGIPPSERLKVLTAITQRMGTSPLVTNFLKVLVTHYRMRILDEVCAAFRRISNDRMGIVHVTVTSAAEIIEPQREAMRRGFSQLIGHEVEFEHRLDPELLGGAVAQIHSTVIDGSIRGELERIRQRLSAD